jgi:hypothetical protein
MSVIESVLSKASQIAKRNSGQRLQVATVDRMYKESAIFRILLPGIPSDEHEDWFAVYEKESVKGEPCFAICGLAEMHWHVTLEQSREWLVMASTCSSFEELTHKTVEMLGPSR